MRQRTDHDVVIVGAGPAGSQLAMRLARQGWSVGLLDRKRFPRKKPCGEFMSPECLPLLEELDQRQTLLRLGARRVRGMRIHGYGREVQGQYRPHAGSSTHFDHGYAIRREVLDTLLLRAAEGHGAVRSYEGWAVTTLERNADGRVQGVRTRDPEGAPRTLRARFTIGADGRQSIVARELGARRFVPALQRYALVTRFRGVPATDHGEVHLFDGGYFAAAPVDSGLFTLNLVVPELPQGRGQLLDFLHERIERAPRLAARLGAASPDQEIAVCGPLAVTTSAQAFDGAALVGDACGFVDPFTGEGLFFAMKGAQLLAESLDAALAAGDTGARALDSYALARRSEFGPRTLLARVLQEGLRHPQLVKLVLSVLERRQGLMELMLGLTGDYVSPRELLNPALWWRALRGPFPRGTLVGRP